ncbi:hypothetical protein BaRGS_00026674 [Batillaria attramentaria]|uniref:THAP-type domain-containing protein n=1 Tax=Batillaria attramentaria TaxID=370345 RepID=A0ABD0K3W4_9CAEN
MAFRSGGGRHCSVRGCSYNEKKLKEILNRPCFDHFPLLRKDCSCDAPFRLHSPKTEEQRREWLANLRLKAPPKYLFVCSFHFVEKKPTLENPSPQCMLGYEREVKVGRRILVRKNREQQPCDQKAGQKRKHSDHSDLLPIPEKQRRTSESEEDHEQEVLLLEATQWELPTCHQYCKQLPFDFVKGTATQTPALPKKTDCGIQCRIDKDLGQASYLIQEDGDAFLYAGIPHHTFGEIVKAMESVAKEEKVPFTMPVADQILMTLMKLRLNLLLEDLARRFSVSVSQVSKVNTFWIRKLSAELGKLIYWLPRETIRATMPECFKSKYPRTTCIIDCAETIMQKAQNLDSRGETYSQYKSHNTGKYLVGISPSGLIMFISSSYGGRASDKFIVQDSGFLNFILPGDEIMADRGFTIEDWVFEKHAKLNIPAFSHGHQLTEEEVASTRRLANVRIHVERAIRRLKVFKILRDTLPVSMADDFDCVLRICAALVNLRGDLVKDTEVDAVDEEDSITRVD